MKYSMLAPVIAAVALAACNPPSEVVPSAPVVVTAPAPAPAATPESTTTIVQVPVPGPRGPQGVAGPEGRPGTPAWDRDHPRDDHDRAVNARDRDDHNDRK